jgi:23S rRNA A1618 N6-methylase RlmF
MDREERIIENEKLFREVNERVAQIQKSFSGPDPEWVCECGDETCFEKVVVSIEEYEQVRRRGDWFVILPGHEKPDIERVVREDGGFLVVEKLGL